MKKQEQQDSMLGLFQGSDFSECFFIVLKSHPKLKNVYYGMRIDQHAQNPLMLIMISYQTLMANWDKVK